MSPQIFIFGHGVPVLTHQTCAACKVVMIQMAEDLKEHFVVQKSPVTNSFISGHDSAP